MIAAVAQRADAPRDRTSYGLALAIRSPPVDNCAGSSGTAAADFERVRQQTVTWTERGHVRGLANPGKACIFQPGGLGGFAPEHSTTLADHDRSLPQRC